MIIPSIPSLCRTRFCPHRCWLRSAYPHFACGVPSISLARGLSVCPESATGLGLVFPFLCQPWTLWRRIGANHRRAPSCVVINHMLSEDHITRSTTSDYRAFKVRMTLFNCFFLFSKHGAPPHPLHSPLHTPFFLPPPRKSFWCVIYVLSFRFLIIALQNQQNDPSITFTT